MGSGLCLTWPSPQNQLSHRTLLPLISLEAVLSCQDSMGSSWLSVPALPRPGSPTGWGPHAVSVWDGHPVAE